MEGVSPSQMDATRFLKRQFDKAGRTPMATMLAGKEIYDEKITALN